MLASANRLRDSSQITRVVRRGNASNGRYFRILLLEGPGPSSAPAESRYTVVVSKKISKRAVTRNYFKRRTREALKAAGMPPDAWGVIFPRPSVGAAPFTELVAELTAWQKKVTKNKG